MMHDHKIITQLDHLIRDEQWDLLVGIDPDVIVKALSFREVLMLSGTILDVDPHHDDFQRDYAVRLLYSLKRFVPHEWEESWANEVHLGGCCSLALRYHEEYYAYMRAASLVNPVPAALALLIAHCYHCPLPIVTEQQKLEWTAYALDEYPCLEALESLVWQYKRMPGQEEKYENYAQLLEKKKNVYPVAPSYPEFPSLTFNYYKLTAPLEITLFRTSPQQVKSWVESQEWGSISTIDPRAVIEALSFEDSLRLAYRLLHHVVEEFKEYAVRLLYALRLIHIGPWLDDWHNSAFLGYACEITKKWEEQFAWYDTATLDLCHRPSLPANLCIALARCCFAPHYPSVSFERAIQLLQVALKEATYLDALELLRRIYAYTAQHEKLLEVDTLVVAQRNKDPQLSPALWPDCATAPFDLV